METLLEAFTVELGDNFSRHLIFHYAVVFILALIPPVLVALDTYFATSTARMLGEKIRSRKLRKGLEKLSFYWGAQIAASLVGTIGLLFTWYNLPYMTIFVTLAVAWTEGKSYREHFIRRKDGVAKIPETLQEMIDFFGEDELKTTLRAIARRKRPTHPFPAAVEADPDFLTRAAPTTLDGTDIPDGTDTPIPTGY